MSNTTFRAGKSRLIYCDDSLPGLTRRKAGRGWAYFDAGGDRVTSRDEIDRLNRFALAEAQGTLPVKALAEQVAARLGNTPAIARKSYIHPAVIALVDRQIEWRETLRLPRATQWLSRYERALIDLLESGPSAAKLMAAA